LLDSRPFDLRGEVRQAGQELVERRVEQADRDREAGHRLEQTLEVLLLERQQIGQRRAAGVTGLGHDHRPHLRLTVLGHEHVLGAAQADPFGPQLPSPTCVPRCVGVGADAEVADLVGPAQDLLKVVIHLRLDQGDVVDGHPPLGPVDRDGIALVQLGLTRPIDGHRLGDRVDRQRLGAHHRGPAHPARHQGRV
jgi:hypothetical protein